MRVRVRPTEKSRQVDPELPEEYYGNVTWESETAYLITDDNGKPHYVYRAAGTVEVIES